MNLGRCSPAAVIRELLLSMGKIITFLFLAWILFVCISWLLIRKFRPHWIGLGQDFNQQKIDSVKYHNCPRCESGTLEPQFKQSLFRPVVGVPPGIINGLGPPKKYICLNCGQSFPGNYFDEKITQISLASRVSRKDALQSIGIMILLFFAVAIYAIFIS